MLSYSYYSTAFFNFKAKVCIFTKNSVYLYIEKPGAPFLSARPVKL